MDRVRVNVRVSTSLYVSLLASVGLATAWGLPASASERYAAANRAPLPGMIPGVDVYVPNPDPQPPVAWSQGTEPPPPQGDYGGGFLQYVITGNETRPAPRPRMPPPYYPQVAAPVGARPAIATYAAPVAADPAGTLRYAVAYGAPGVVAYNYAAPTGAVAQVEVAIDPAYRRQEVAFMGGQGPGTIVIDTGSKFLYLVEGGGRALRYGIGVGRPGFLWSGVKTITRKAEWPDWVPPSEMLARRPDLPRHMEGGMANPLGARALYLGSSLYRIHGTNEPNTIGTNVSSGCIRLLNEDVADLYARVRVGTKVIVM